MKPTTTSKFTSLILAASLASSPAFAADSAAASNAPGGVQKRPKHPNSLGVLLGKPDQPMVDGDPNRPGVLGRVRNRIESARAERAEIAIAREASYGDPAQPKMGKVVRDATGPAGQRVLYTGDLSERRALPRVLTVSNTGAVSYGTRNPDGSILWDGNGKTSVVPSLVKDHPDVGSPRPKANHGVPSTLVYDDATKQVYPTPSARKDIPLPPPPSQTGSGDPQTHRPYKEPIVRNPKYDPKSALKNESAKPPGHVVEAQRAQQAGQVPDFNAQTRAIESGKPLMNTPTVGETRGVKPSQWRRALDIAPEQAKSLGTKAVGQVKRAGNGIYELAFPGSKTGNAGGDAAINMNSLPASSVAFAAALGGAAAINAAFFSGTHPLAIDQTKDMLTDEVTWLSMFGYILTTNYINTKTPIAKVLQGNGGVIKKSGAFGLGLALGSLAQIGIMEFANDPDVRACVGFTNYHKTGNPFNNGREFPAQARDYEACDRAFAKDHLRDIAQRIFVDKFIPAAATMVVAGGLFYAAALGTGKLLTLTKVFGRFSGVAAGATGLPGLGLRLALTFGPSIGAQILFQALIDKPAQATFQEWSKFRQAIFTKQDGVYAATAQNAETDLYESWNRVKKANWADPTDTKSIKDVCYDESRVGSKYYDCKAGNVADFEGALATYDAQQAAWREQALAPTRALHEQWKQKVTNYHQLYAYTQNFYKDAVAKIVYTLKNPGAPDSDPMVFNLANMKVSTHTRWLPDGARSLFYWATFIETHDGPFRFVATPNLNELLMASLACGPQIEGATAPGMFERGVNLVRSVYGDLPPQEMIQNSAGRKVVFSPPRIVDTNVNVCDQTTGTPFFATWAKADVSNFEIRTKEKTYVGLPKFILDHVSNTVVARDLVGDPNRLPGWWNDFVLTQDKKVNDELAVEYQDVVDKFFKPALVNKDYYFCENHGATKGSRLEDYLYRLGGTGEVCGTSKTKRLADGVLNNLRDQSRLYVALMMDLYISNAQTFGAPLVRNAAPTYPMLLTSTLQPARNLLEAYDRFALQYGTQADPVEMTKSLTELTESFKAFTAIVNPPAQVQLAAIGTQPFQREWMSLLENNLNTSLATLTAYVQLASLPRVGGLN